MSVYFYLNRNIHSTHIVCKHKHLFWMLLVFHLQMHSEMTVLLLTANVLFSLTSLGFLIDQRYSSYN